MNIYKDETITRYCTNYLKTSEDTDSRGDAFRKGWEACLIEQQRVAALNKQRKEKKLIIGDFVCDKKERAFLTGFYCENGFKIATDGCSLIKIKESYPVEWDKKIINPKTEEEIEGTFPKYEKVIPDTADMTESSITLEDVRIMRSCDKRKTPNTLRHVYISVNNEVGFSMLSIDKLLKAWESMPNAKLYRHDDLKKSYMLIDGENKFVVMPLCSAEGCTFKYTTSDKIIMKGAA